MECDILITMLPAAMLECLVISDRAKAKTIQDVKHYVTNLAGTGRTSSTEGFARLLNAFANTKFRMISGYRGSGDAMMALESGEVDSVGISWNTMVRNDADLLAKGHIRALVQGSLERSPELPNTPTVVETGQTPEGKSAMAFYTSSEAVGRAMITTPGVPADRLKALRDAFDATEHDPDFLAQIKQSHSEFSPASGEYLQDLAHKVAATPKEIVERHK